MDLSGGHTKNKFRESTLISSDGCVNVHCHHRCMQCRSRSNSTYMWTHPITLQFRYLYSVTFQVVQCLFGEKVEFESNSPILLSTCASVFQVIFGMFYGFIRELGKNVCVCTYLKIWVKFFSEQTLGTYS